jgi:hypothetical protein
MASVKYIFVFVAFVFLAFATEARISEVMYNPPGTDNNKEYVELIFDSPKMMKNWSVTDNKSSDVLILMNGSGNSRINLIVEEGYNVSFLNLNNVSVYSVGVTIGDNLNNGGDIVIVSDSNGSVIDSVSYDGGLANGNNKSICFFKNKTVYECYPSPGKENEIPPIDPGNETNGEENETEEENITLERVEDGYISIDYIKYPKDGECGNLNVGVVFWNTLNRKENVIAYIRDIEVYTSLKVNPDKGQMVELPVATCDGEVEREKGEYVLIVEGFGEMDMMIIELEGFDSRIEETTEEVIVLENVIESNINEELRINSSFDSIEPSLENKSLNGGEWLSKITIWLVCLIGGLGAYYIMFKW